jgi:mRNA interferase RelE/StbE
MSGLPVYSIVFTPTAEKLLQSIPDRRIQQKILDTIKRLTSEPEKQGKLLLGPLTGYRSLRAAGQRYRIVYKVEQARVIVIIVAVGLRKEGDKHDIYRRIQKLLHLKLL